MKFPGHASIFVLLGMMALGFIYFDGTAWAQQQTTSQQTQADDPEAEAQEAQEQEVAAAQQQQQQRRRRGPNKAKIEFNGKDVVVQYGDWKVDGADYANVANTPVGRPIEATLNAALKLITDWDLRFGEDTLIKKENVAKNYPGVYSLWIKRTADGWSLAFNEKADVWGTMYDSESDVAEIHIDYTDTEEPNDKMEITLEDRDGGALLTISWGKHQWITTFDPVPES